VNRPWLAKRAGGRHLKDTNGLELFVRSPNIRGILMSDCLHCDINELVAKYAERPDSDASELAARMAESLVDLILMAPESDRATLLADVIAVLGQLYLEKSGVVEPGESTARH
jgi:hypothetical protein